MSSKILARFNRLSCLTNSLLLSILESGHYLPAQSPLVVYLINTRQTGRQADRSTDRQADRQADRSKDNQAGRQTDRQTDRQRHSMFSYLIYHWFWVLHCLFPLSTSTTSFATSCSWTLLWISDSLTKVCTFWQDESLPNNWSKGWNYLCWQGNGK